MYHNYDFVKNAGHCGDGFISTIMSIVILIDLILLGILLWKKIEKYSSCHCLKECHKGHIDLKEEEKIKN